MIRRITTVAVVAAGMALAPAVAIADEEDLPEEGEVCELADRDVELEDGTVLTCDRDRGAIEGVWVVVEDDDDDDDDDEDDGKDDDDNGKDEDDDEDGKDDDGKNDDDEEDDNDNGNDEDEGNGDDGADSAWADYVADQESAPEGVHPGQFCANDDAGLIYAYTSESVIQCQYDDDPEVQQYRWVECHSAHDLVTDEDDGTDGEGEDKPAPDDGTGDDKAPEDEADTQLPVTGAALGGLVAAAVAALGGGGAALWLTRRRRAMEV